MTRKTPTELAALIIQEANDGYHQDAANYPPFARLPWEDRVRWSAYLETCAERVLERELYDHPEG